MKINFRLLAVVSLAIATSILFYYCGVFDGYSGKHFVLNAFFPKNVLANLAMLVVIVPAYALWLYVRSKKSK